IPRHLRFHLRKSYSVVFLTLRMLVRAKSTHKGQTSPDLRRICMDATLRQQIIEREVNARLYPKPGDPLYIHLADLLAVLQKVATLDHVKILDYGAGLAPYFQLFPHADYRTADVGPSLVLRNGFVATPARNEAFATPDYTISADGSVETESSTFDYVLSTQVLEHVVDPQMHLAESLRILTPGGKLFLTTHGSYEDHGSPFDFRRWTADGLQYDLRKSGFEVLSIDKITTG